MSIFTGQVIPLSCTISIDQHSRYCSFICIMSLIIQIRLQYLTGHIIKLKTMKMRSLRSWTEIDWTWQSLCELPLKIKRIVCAMSSCLRQENVCCPNFKNTCLELVRPARGGGGGGGGNLWEKTLLRGVLKSTSFIWTDIKHSKTYTLEKEHQWARYKSLGHVIACNENYCNYDWLTPLHYMQNKFKDSDSRGF